MRRRKLEPLSEYRQSLTTSVTKCGRRTRFDLERGDVLAGWTETSADLGTVAHAVIAEILRTLYRHGEAQMPTQEAVEVMREVYGASKIALPADDRDALRGMILGFCEIKWQATRIMALEERLTADIVCPDGVTRTLKGQPDLLMADPPQGVVIGDWKGGRGKPKEPRQAPADGEVVQGKQYLSDRGHGQLDAYGLLVMRNYPSVQYALLREYHLRSGAIREAALTRDELEHVEWELGDLMMKIDQGIAEGPRADVWKPRAGSHCVRACPVARSCPIPPEQRGDGVIDSPAKAVRAAAAFVVAKAQYEQLRGQLKEHHEATGKPIPVNPREEIRWDPPVGKPRKFGLHERLNGNGASDVD